MRLYPSQGSTRVAHFRPQIRSLISPCLMSLADKTLINIATYNEIENLPHLVEEIFRYAPDAHLLVVDDNSRTAPDNGSTNSRRVTNEYIVCTVRKTRPRHGNHGGHEVRD